MTLPLSTRRADYTGTGAAHSFSPTFKIFDDDDLDVLVEKTSDGTITTLVKTTDYTVTGVGAATGFTLALVNASQAWLDGDGDLKSGYTLAILSNRTFLQDTSIRNQGPYYPNVIEDEFDKQLVLLQQLKEKLNRAIVFKKTSTETGILCDFTLSGNAGKILAINDDEDAIELGPTVDSIASDKAAAATSAASAASSASASESSATDSASSAAAAVVAQLAAAASAVAAALSAATAGGTPVQEAPSGSINDSNVSFTLSHTPSASARVLLYLDGMFQRQGTDYTISSATITMIAAPATGQTMDAFYLY